MNKNSWIKKVLIKIRPMLAFVILFSIYVSVSSATVDVPNIEQGDGIWGTINVDTPGLVSVNAYDAPFDPNDRISLKLYNQTGDLVDSNYGSTASIDYFAPTAGIYEFKVILAASYFGGTRTISVSSSKQLSLMPKYIQRGFDIGTGGAIYYDQCMKEGELVFINAWSKVGNTGSGQDLISLHLYNQTGEIASNSGWRAEIDYVAPVDGTYTAKAVLTSVYMGGTRTLSLSSNAPPGCIIVASPDGGEVWEAGTTQEIRWTYYGNPGSNVNIELLKGGINSTINSSVPIGSSGSGSYIWTIPMIQTPGTDYKVRITSTTNPVFTDSSNNNFTIIAQTPIVSIKTDKSKYSPGETMTVTLGIYNPTSNPVTLGWHIGVPQTNTWVTYVVASIPAGYSNTHTIPIPVGNWGPSPFGLVNYVHMLDPVSGEVLAQDSATFAYSPSGAATSDVDIAKEIKKSIKKVELK